MKQSITKELVNFFPAYPVEKAWIFGSYARGEETRESDVDIMNGNSQEKKQPLIGK